MEDSIFLTIKSLLGYESFYDPSDSFDSDIMIHINTYLGVLNTLGIGVEGFFIEDDSATWSDFLDGSNVSLNEAKTYIYLRVRQAFDPPTSGILSAEFDKQIDELGWRMTTKVECSAEA